jgi:N12 class adenine-specific DNA methylase
LPRPPAAASAVAGGDTDSDGIEAAAGSAEPARFRAAGQDDLAPSGAVTRARANIEALRLVREIEQAGRPATADEQRVLARWSGWGAVPDVFDERREQFGWARDALAEVLTDRELAAAAANTLNAHYTDAALVREIWDGVRQLGFAGGEVLEPGCGSGTFIGAAPADARMTGVEVEPVTASIARHLYPDAEILTESFANIRAAQGAFDLTIGNVPFGDYVLNDKRHNAAGHSIHNHFLIKSLQLTRPGGLVVAITSRYTMDAQNPAARREMDQLADLVAAVRLPTDAHQRAAGTRVVTDLLILRRREPGAEPAGSDWEQTNELRTENGTLRVNEYFLAHPEHVLGEMTNKSGRWDNEIDVRGDNAPARLAGALREIAEQARADGLAYGQRSEAPVADRRGAMVAGRSDRAEGYLQVAGDGFTRISEGVPEPHSVPTTQAAELRALLGLRDVTVALLEAEAATLDDDTVPDHLRGDLNTRYDAYTAEFGPINRTSTRRTGRTDPDTGEEKMAQVRPPQGGFRTDPWAPTVYALENFDQATQLATRADIFRQRVVAPRPRALGADTPADALAISLDTLGRADISEIARLLGVPKIVAREQLGTLVFEDPVLDRMVPAGEYLSGNVRQKLAAAIEAAAGDPRYDANVAALREAQPRDVAPGDIRTRLGASWISDEYVQQFLRETLEDPTLRVEHGGGSMWEVKGNRQSVLARLTWGTTRVPAPDLAQSLLELRPIVVRDTIEVGDSKRSVLNATATAEAMEKGVELNERFAEWIWADPDRTRDLAKVYNERHNAVVERNYDNMKLSLPGLALTFKPRPHQVAAVAKMIHEPAAGLFHVVGAGKTAEMVMGVMELGRLDMVGKPTIVVPNHMLDQFGRDFGQLYPQAKILAASGDDLTAAKRREFVARCATGQWDAVIMTRSAFEKVQMSLPAQEAYLDSEIDVMRQYLVGKSDGSLTVKRLQASIKRAEERLKAKLETTKDPGITFEQTGIDYLCVDEAHDYKNLRTITSIPGAAIEGSQRATDLDSKLHYLRNREGTNRVVTLATATPITNSITETHVMLRLLRPDLLADAGVLEYDCWAGTYGEMVTGLEMSPDGGSYRMKTRFSRITNVPELLRMWLVPADVKTAEDLNLPTPRLAARPEDGQRLPRNIVIEPSAELLELVQDLGERAERIRQRLVEPEVDNMLRVSHHGRSGALDLRLLGRDTQEDTKVVVAAREIASRYHANRENVYLLPDGSEHPTRGALQLVFSDLGTPSDAWNVYDELREQLVARGVPRPSVRFVHEARNDREKGALFAACRSGQVAVLMGSTAKMGVGTNVQLRAITLHHLDVPWRPSDIEQRDGRIKRQGNQNEEIEILRYVTGRSFDTYSWQTVERKARGFEVMLRGHTDVREIEDIGDSVMSYAEVKAIASGDPRIIEKAQLDIEVTKLQRLERSHRTNQRALGDSLQAAEKAIASHHAVIDAVDQALSRRVSTAGEAFVMRVDQTRLTDRKAAGTALKNRLGHGLAQLTASHRMETELGTIATIGGFEVTATAWRSMGSTGLQIVLVDVPGSGQRWDSEKFAETSAAGLISRLENRITGLERHRATLTQEIAGLEHNRDRASEQIGKPFPRADELRQAEVRQSVLDAQIQADAMEAAAAAEAASQQQPNQHESGSDDEGNRGTADDAVRDVLGMAGMTEVAEDDAVKQRLKARAAHVRASGGAPANLSEKERERRRQHRPPGADPGRDAGQDFGR